VVGRNGTGKTTVMRLLLGMLRPSAGHATVDVWDVAKAPSATWAHVGHLVDHPLVYPELTRAPTWPSRRVRTGLPRGKVGAAIDRVVTDLDLGRYLRTRAAVSSRRATGTASVWPPPSSTTRPWSSWTSRQSASTRSG
jgi:ABC-2 type transport system ATP-binding protein